LFTQSCGFYQQKCGFRHGFGQLSKDPGTQALGKSYRRPDETGRKNIGCEKTVFNEEMIRYVNAQGIPMITYGNFNPCVCFLFLTHEMMGKTATSLYGVLCVFLITFSALLNKLVPVN